MFNLFGAIRVDRGRRQKCCQLSHPNRHKLDATMARPPIRGLNGVKMTLLADRHHRYPLNEVGRVEERAIKRVFRGGRDLPRTISLDHGVLPSPAWLWPADPPKTTFQEGYT